MTRNDERAILLVVAAFLAFALLLSFTVPVEAGDETCRPEPVTEHMPSGVAGCTLDGPTAGKASVWTGNVAAAQWCVYPWTDCGSARVQSHATGVTITVPVGMVCDCYWLSDRRLIDLTRSQVLALGLEPSDGIFAVTVTPLTSGGQVSSSAPVTMADTAVAR